MATSTTIALFYFLSFAIAWILSVLIKTALNSYTKKKNLDIKDGLETGGMPSSHSTVVTAITFSVLLLQGPSTTFFVSLVLSLIVISDAFMLRYNVGVQAEKLNILLKKAKQKEVKVAHGHTLPQVVAGMLLGIFVSMVMFILMF